MSSKFLLKITSLVKIIRPINVLITFLSVFAICIICSTEIPNYKIILLASLSQSFLAASAYVINDIFDLEIDRINRPARVLVKKSISKITAYIYYSILSLSALLLSLLIGDNISLIMVFSILLVFIYSYRLKSLPLIGNITVSFITGFAFIYAGISVENLNDALIPFIFAFLINMIRELLKDIEDIAGDKNLNLKTFPIVFGIKNSKKVIFALCAVLIAATFYPYMVNYYNIYYFVIVLCLVNIPLLFFIKKINDIEELSKLAPLSNLLKLIMIFGLFAIYTGSF